MKYIKTYEAEVGYYPNTTDKQYWVFYYDDNNDKGEKIIFVLKFIKYDKEYNGEYFFDAITLTNYNEDGKSYNKGDKVEDFSFYDSGIRLFQKNDKLRLATPEEIELYNMYSQQNKYNL